MTLLRRTLLPLVRLQRLGTVRSVSRTSSNAIASLQEELPHIEVTTNPYELDTHGRGESFHPSAPPDAVVTPSSQEEVVDIVQHCAAHRIPIIPFGAGTSLEGHVSALRGGLCVDLRSLNTIETFVDESSGMPETFARVGAGVTRLALNEELRYTGMQFMVDPGADATIGGMIATGASGTQAVKFGTMRENLLGLECVLPNATVARCGTKALKSSAGYDLTSLMTGSEGTLGIITSATVKLHPIPEHVVAAKCVFDNLVDAAQAVATLKLCGVDLGRCELLDEASIMAFNEYNTSQSKDESAGLSGESTTGYGNGATVKALAVKPTIFFEFQGPTAAAVQEQADTTRTICIEDLNGSEFECATDDEERRRLWSARHSLYYACLAQRPGSIGAVVTDVCVPLSGFANLIEKTARDVKELGVVGPCFGHAGDGNFHCILPLRSDDSEEYRAKINKVNDNLVERALELGGTCTGEHGIGYGKMEYLEKQFGKGGVEMMRTIKRAIDPDNIMNPGKVVLT